MDPPPPDSPPADPVAARRAEIDARQEQMGAILAEIGCEGALLLLPQHLSWFTVGMHARGLAPETERPAVFTNGVQRWVLCAGIDTQRLFDEELDGLGFQLKEWGLTGTRADLLADIATGKKLAADRPYPNMPLLVDRLRPVIRVLSRGERDACRDLGARLSHSLEATARNIAPGETEQEVAGHVAHRLLRHGAEPVALSVAADDRGRAYRRPGFTSAPVTRTCTFQATAARGGVHVTASRTVSFGPPPDALRTEYEHATVLAAAFRAVCRPGETAASAAAVAPLVLANSGYEFDLRAVPPVYGAGRYAAEELRRGGKDEPFVAAQPLVWQARVGAAAVVDTVLVGLDGPQPLTPPIDWPFKRVRVRDQTFDIPALLVRDDA